MKVFFWLLHPDPKSRATLKDLQKDKWTNQAVDLSVYSFNAVLGNSVMLSFMYTLMMAFYQGLFLGVLLPQLASLTIYWLRYL